MTVAPQRQSSQRQNRHYSRCPKAYYAKYTPPDGGVYLIDHTGFIYLMDRAGKYLGFFPPGTSANRIVEIIRPYLASD
jgi:protein SCO1/2